MSSNDIHGIEQGWSVKTADGQSIGTVEETTETYILVKSGLLNTAHRYLPAATLAHVRPELKEIGISLTKDVVEASDWSEAPTDPPRTEGAPLNEDAYEETDPVAAGTIRGPEKPVSL
jgi:hypothetical protein